MLECLGLRGIPEVSTMVVVRLLSIPGGIVIIGTMVWMLAMNVSFTNEVMRLEVRKRNKGVNTLTFLLPNRRS